MVVVEGEEVVVVEHLRMEVRMQVTAMVREGVPLHLQVLTLI